MPMCVTATILEQNLCEFIDNVSVSSWEIKNFSKLRVFLGGGGAVKGLEAGELGFGVPEKWLSPPTCLLTGSFDVEPVPSFLLSLPHEPFRPSCALMSYRKCSNQINCPTVLG